jgi:hypothetical protein
MVLHSADAGQRELERGIHSRARVREAQRFGFDAVHEDDPDPGEGIVVELAIGRLDELLPREALAIEGNTLVSEQIQPHYPTPYCREGPTVVGKRRCLRGCKVYTGDGNEPAVRYELQFSLLTAIIPA